jgi:methionyl-tRNA formyltransferase
MRISILHSVFCLLCSLFRITLPTMSLRIISFNNRPGAFDIACRWVEANGHELVLVVTSPGPKTRRSEVLSTTRMKSVATPVVRALQPDLIVSMSFPWLLPPELLATARLGAINVHPALLPAYRGPNAFRQIYDGAPMIGSTAHWLSGEFDTGNILAQCSVPLPARCTSDAVAGSLFPTLAQALFEGAPRAIAGEAGSAQDESRASYAGPFQEHEAWLDFDQPAVVIQRQVTALNFADAKPFARARIAGRDWAVARADPLEGQPASGAPGTLLEQTADGLLISTRDGQIMLIATDTSSTQQ